MSIIDIFQEVWAIRALIASSMVGVMCGVLGAFIVLRNMSLIGDALSHAILPGVVVAFVVFGYSSFGFFIGAVVAGLVAAVAITWIQENVKTKNDAAIGIVFTAMFSLGVIGISRVSKTDGVHLDLKDFLFGNILGVSDQDLILTATVSVFVILSIIVLYRYLFISTFQPVIARTMGFSVSFIHYYLMLLLSFAVVASLQTVGVILVVAMLITPASTALLLTNRLKKVLLLSGIIGLLSAVSGLYFAIILDSTPGPLMAVCATGIYLITAFLAPQKGILSRYLVRRSQKNKIIREDILKRAFKLDLNGALNMDTLLERMDESKGIVKKQIDVLSAKNLLTRSGKEVNLTKTGKDRANNLVRAHRLWESYLVEKMGLTEAQIHDDAERFEHLLTEELLDEVDEHLGFPDVDPHGSPIPAKEFKPAFALSQLRIDQKAQIARRQIGEDITHELWKLGLVPMTDLKIVGQVGQFFVVETSGKELKIPKDLANKISVAVI